MARVSNLIKLGKIPKSCYETQANGRRLIDVAQADQALLENLDQIRNPHSQKNPQQPTEGIGGMSMADAQKLQAKLKAALLKLDYDERVGALVSASQVEKDFFNVARLVRDAILNIPDRISAELASITDVHVISEKLTAELTVALEELSNGK